MAQRTVSRIIPSSWTIEGAGVRLRRAIGNNDTGRYDPFLLLDDFHSGDPADYRAGFPWHPHRGIETMTYLIAGRVRHEDSMGSNGVIGPGDAQWMTAGSGIIHSEIPDQKEGLLRGLQLWINLPASQKMMPPRYRDIASASIPVISPSAGASIRILAGAIGGTRGPAQDIVADPLYIDTSLEPGASLALSVKSGHTVFLYVLDGDLDAGSGTIASADHLVHYGDGDRIVVAAGTVGARFILASGKPIGEPIAWGGPIVMNTEEELRTAFHEYQEGTFIKTRG